MTQHDQQDVTLLSTAGFTAGVVSSRPTLTKHPDRTNDNDITDMADNYQ